MKLPQITDTLSGYQYEWTEEHIKIGVSRIKNTDEKVSGEITVSTDAPGYSPHLHQALFNFSSTRSRDELAKRLNKQFDHTDWEVILEQLSVYTLERVRRGEPVVTLYASQEVVPPKYLLEPLIIQNLPNCIYGDPGSLKSNTALLLTQLIQLPWYDNPLSFHVPEPSTFITVPHHAPLFPKPARSATHAHRKDSSAAEESRQSRRLIPPDCN